ncbi:MAG: hypothetical protein ACJ76I_05930 [Gaiellaceae bacterium]
MTSDFLADAQLDLLADRLEQLDEGEIAARRDALRRAEQDAERDASDAAERLRRVKRRRLVVDLLLVGKSDTAVVEYKWPAGEYCLNRVNDPRGHQRAVIEILSAASELLTPFELRERLRDNLAVDLSLPAMQNLLSRMARRNPPLVARPARGLYGPPPPDVLTVSSTNGGRRRRNHEQTFD